MRALFSVFARSASSDKFQLVDDFRTARHMWLRMLGIFYLRIGDDSALWQAGYPLSQ